MPYVPSKKTPNQMKKYSEDDRESLNKSIVELANAIAWVSKKYGYDGAFLGELNYALTRLIQELPRSLMGTGQIKEETRYWLQAGLFGVLLDVILEYKRRVNTSYEAEQIQKSGDCYDTPYYTRLIEVIDEDGNLVGHQEVMVKRNESNKDDLLPYMIIVRKNEGR